jgi:protein phosphatase
MTLTIPDPSLVLLIGPTGAGKTTFARRFFGPFEVVSSGFCRGVVGNDEGDQGVTHHAFDVMHYIVRKRLMLRRLTVADATNVRREDRKPLLDLARDYGVPAVAIVFDMPEDVCCTWNQQRPDRQVGPDVVRQHRDALDRSLPSLADEGFAHVYRLTSPDDLNTAVIARQRF